MDRFDAYEKAFESQFESHKEWLGDITECIKDLNNRLESLEENAWSFYKPADVIGAFKAIGSFINDKLEGYNPFLLCC